MDEAVRLAEIEAIKTLKARYCRLLDAKQWDAWRELFTDDFVSDTSQCGGQVVSGADEFIAFLRRTLGKPSQVTVHQVHAPEIEITGPSSARGVWALNDIVHLAPGVNLNGYGHYHETYVKAGGQWRIATSTLTRIREDFFNAAFSIPISPRVRDAGAGLARRFGSSKRKG